MTAYLTLEAEPSINYRRTLEIEAGDDEIVLWEEVDDYAAPHQTRLAIPLHLAETVAARIMRAVREARDAS